MRHYQREQLTGHRRIVRAAKDFFRNMATVFAGIVLVGGLIVLGCAGYAYEENGYNNCRANGSSYAWCKLTSEWQSLKALFQRG